MANEILDAKYRDMFGINPKYECIIESKLNDRDCYHAFQVLVNTALKNLIEEIEGKTRIGLIEPRLFRKFYGYNNDGCAPCPYSAKELNQKIGNLYAPARLTKYVNDGLMKRGKLEIRKNENYLYYLPYDFFTTNNPVIKFVPFGWERY